jgi:uncharacterized protein
LLTLGVATAGGAVANYLTLPLPWMIGPMLSTTALALGGVRIHMPRLWANLMIPVLGLWLGSSFTPDLLAQMVQWYPSVLGLFGWMFASGGACFLYFRKVAGLDRVTAFFSAMPGGMTDMTLIGTALGGDERVIPLIHSVRMLITILTIPFWFRFVMHVPSMAQRTYVGVFDVAAQDIAILAACAVVGTLAAHRLRLPAPYMFGAMILSAVVHLTGITTSRPPSVLVSVAQILVGASIGTRFVGVSIAYIGRTAGQAALATFIILASTVVFASAVHAISGDLLPALVLSYSPGGLAEMSLVAIALGVDPAFVALHHLLRVTSVVMIAPLIFRVAGGRRS